jgi:tight adherence protein B
MPGQYLVLLFGIVLALTLLSIGLALRFLESSDKKKLEEILRRTVGGAAASKITAIFVDDSKGDVWKRFVAASNLMKRLEATLQQADLDWSVGRMLLTMGACGAAGVLLATRFSGLATFAFVALIVGPAFALLPLLYVLQKRNRRVAAFESQFPEALDFMARSMKVGHAFTVSLEMLSKESPDPLGMEFRRLFNEQNLGAPLDVAFQHMAARMPLADLRFFISTVLLQKETGGNLAEILSKLATVIRERFKLKGQVRAASAHGRMTALILGILPVVLALALMAIAPGYLQSLTNDPDGRYIVMGAVVAQLLGFYCMKRIIDIKV